MIAFMIYLIIGAIFATCVKLSGEVKKQMSNLNVNNTLGTQIIIFVAITIFWLPSYLKWGLKRKGGN